ncbi:MAG TPA: tetratricopeptide repeat protein, partial [Luteimonas sp.]|nr:tetratricopeptide repeat protein [Luteimonas sp.]
ATGRAISLRNDTGYRMRVFLRRHRWSASAAAVAIVALLGTTGWALWQQRQAVYQAQVANKETRTANSVKTLVTDMFDSVSPEVSLGETITVRQMLDKNRTALFRALEGEPTVAVEMLVVMAKSYAALGDHKQAWELLDRALPLLSDVDAERKAEVFSARLRLAQQQGSLIKIRKEAAALGPLVGGIRHSGSKVTALLALSNYLESEAIDGKNLAAAALKIAMRSFPPGDLHRLRAMRALAAAEGSKDSSGRSERLLLDGLSEAERHLPQNHPEITSQRRQLIAYYRETNQFEKAVPHANRALSEGISVYGENGLLVAADRLWVSGIMIRAGDYLAAREQLGKALDTYAASPGELSLQRAGTEKLLGDVEEYFGNYPLAQVLYERALERYVKTSRERYSIPHMRMNVARAMLKQGNTAQAAAIYRSVLEAQDGQTAALAAAKAGLGTVARMSNDARGGLALHRQALLEMGDPKTIRSRFDKIRSLALRLEMARDHAALEQRRDSMEALKAVVGELNAEFPFDSPGLADAYLLLGEQLRAEGRTEDSRRLMAKHAELMARMKGIRPRTYEMAAR